MEPPAAPGLVGWGGADVAGWIALPSVREPRWLLPRGPRLVATGGLNVYHPVTLKARVGWEVARALSRLGAFSVLPARGTPPPGLWDALHAYVPAGGSVSISRATHPGRSVALIVARDGTSVVVAKLATDQHGRDALAREAREVARLGGLLSAPLSAPTVLGHADGVLVVEAVEWQARWRSWRLPEEVAFALGAFFRAGPGAAGGRNVGLSHGDVAPWNFLKTRTGWLLIDWENADEARPAFHDLMHYLVESFALLRRPSLRTLVAGLLGEGNWVGAAVAAYAGGARIPVAEARPFFLTYLRDSIAEVDPQGPAARREVDARKQVLDALSGSVASGRSGRVRQG